MREACVSPRAHRGARVIGTDALRISLILQEPSDCEEYNQDNEDNPNIDAHQSRLLPTVHTRGAAGTLTQRVWGALATDQRSGLPPVRRITK